ncbi:MAG: Copper-transporting P-type ATPase [Planctomycetota bacterium]|jgi:heavy metal translocating P-type ATPase
MNQTKANGSQERSAWMQIVIAGLAVAGILLHLVLRLWIGSAHDWHSLRVIDLPLIAVLLLGGVPLVIDLLGHLIRMEFGSDLLAGISIVTSAVLGEYLAGSMVVLMLSGGEALEAYAVRRATSALAALAKRLPSVAHRLAGSRMEDIPLEAVNVGDLLIILPHETSPVDGTVIEGHSTMDESFLTGEPYHVSKAPGTSVISGAINGETAITIKADRKAEDSRYAKIMRVMQESEQSRPKLRRLGDQLGAIYTPLSVTIAIIAWTLSNDPTRFLAVLVVATPCPLLIAIPVAILGSISLAARRGIIIKDPSVLERLSTCRTAIFDKTGTLTYGRPKLAEIRIFKGFNEDHVIRLAAGLERYSKHPLAEPLMAEALARKVLPVGVSEVSEKPGQGLVGKVENQFVQITSRAKWLKEHPEDESFLPEETAGLQCVVAVDGKLASLILFRDEPRPDGQLFIQHLSPRHRWNRILLVSGDRESEVRYLADHVGITEVHASVSPEGKVEITRAENAKAPTVFMGDGINDAPALAAATVGVSFGQNSDITSEAAGAVVMDGSLRKVDELLHIGDRLRRVALQSAVGGMVFSLGGMILACFGLLTPVAGAILQELIDLIAVFNALRTAFVPRRLTDYETNGDVESLI